MSESTGPQAPSPELNPPPGLHLPPMTSSSSSSSSSPPTNEPLEEDESGYGSDSSPDILTEDSTDSCSCKATEDEADDDSDLAEKIYFLREKQHILERASSYFSRRPEDSYAAAMASVLCHGPAAESSISNSSTDEERPGRQPSSIWSEARHVLNIVTRRADFDEPCSISVPTRVHRKRCAPNPRSPLINPRIVQMVSAKRYESGCDTSRSSCCTEIPPEVGTANALSSLAVNTANQWLTKALLWNNSRDPLSSRSDPAVDPWTVTDADAFTSSRELVAPPSMSFRNAFDLQDVINVSDEARIVTQSSPPFCIVHVNRAALEYAELPKFGTLVGRPIETVFQVNGYHVAPASPRGCTTSTTTSTGNGYGEGEDEASRRYMSGTVLLGKRKACQLRVMPVVDRSRRRRVTGPNPAGGAIQCMSHVLIRVEAPRPPTQASSSSLLLSSSSSFMPIQRYSSPTSRGANAGAVGLPSTRRDSASSLLSSSSSSTSTSLNQAKTVPSASQISAGMIG